MSSARGSRRVGLVWLAALVMATTSLAGCTGVLDTTVDPRASMNAYPLQIQEGETVTFDARDSEAVEGVITSYEWDFGDGSPNVNSIDAFHTYNQVGTFTVTLTVEYDYGCVLQSTKKITVTKGYSLVLPNAFSPNEDGINDVIRPSFKGFTSIKMSIYDTWGVRLYFEEGTTLTGWNGFIKENPAENGNYIMYVSGRTFFGKEIKQSTSITLLK